jgi:hypothetical protein
MNKRLVKRHKRQVARANERVKVSEPDVRTTEQLVAAREGSRALSSLRNNPHAHYYSASSSHSGRVKDNPAKLEVES